MITDMKFGDRKRQMAVWSALYLYVKQQPPVKPEAAFEVFNYFLSGQFCLYIQIQEIYNSRSAAIENLEGGRGHTRNMGSVIMM